MTHQLYAGAMRSSHQHPGLVGTRRPSKQDLREKDRDSRDLGSEHQQDRNRVPLEALVRKSSPIAVAKQEEPAEPQVFGAVLHLAQKRCHGWHGSEARHSLRGIQLYRLHKMADACVRPMH